MIQLNKKLNKETTMEKDYYLGLDMGSASVGWAVTDDQYHILRAHGKALWGTRLFESANTAEDRRINRTARRRLKRRNQRIEWLQEIFAEEIAEKDSGFFRRMKESRYWAEDKRDENGNCPEMPYLLFIDKEFTDKEYHEKFPTIYHLRKYLMTTEETPDIRLVYLAFHHMMKHRGHFLLNGSIEEIREFRTTFDQFLEVVRNEEMGFDGEITEETYHDIEKILKNVNLTRSAKKTTLIKLLKVTRVKEKELLALISGCTVKLSNIFNDKSLDETERPKISFADAGFDDYEVELKNNLNERYYIIESAKAVYDWAALADILNKYSSISEAKVALYEKHHKDLQHLKKIVKEDISIEAYKEIFTDTSGKYKNYCAYIGTVNINGKKKDFEGKKCTKEDFYAYLKKSVIERINDSEKTDWLKKELETGNFLPKQSTGANSVIPYQIHLYELNAIITNLQERIPLLKREGDKIRQIFTFRVPYYVGPLNGISIDGKKTNWVKRKEGKIYPWNFTDIVDEEVSAERFIRRMTNKCTYLIHEDVLPKYSLLYSKFEVLNELNNVRLNGELLSVKLKQKIYEEVFQRYRKVTQKKFKRYLLIEGKIDENTVITGIDGDFKGSLTAYHDFKEKLTDVHLSEREKEEIILNVTLFGDARSLLRKRIGKICPQLTDKQKESLSNLSYRGWGRLSKKFLNGIAISVQGEEEWTIIKTLWGTQDNLSQLLSAKYTFRNEVEKENGQLENKEISYETIKELNISPSVKRQVWQALLIVKEICKIQKTLPKRVFVEVAKEKTNSGRTESRKKRLLDLYKYCSKYEKELYDENLQSKLEKCQEADLRSDRLFLYYTQMGRCMYTGLPIDLDELWNNQKYDIDHIYPQSKTMDDSIDNRVLVKRILNLEKTDVYPIQADIREKCRGFWKALKNAGFISEEKYKRLTRATEFEPAELAGFISRQLVENRQTTKVVASILKQAMPDTEIVYVKARTVSEFRHKFNFIKVRDMNDLHHAKDAYLNIVVGNTYLVKFTKSPVNFIENHSNRSYNLKKLFTYGEVERNGEIAWISGENGTIGTVRNIMKKNNILVTRRVHEATGGLFDQQLMKKGKGQVPVKGSDERLCDIEKYGGYNKEAGAYFVLVESDEKKGKKKRTIEYVPIRLKKQLENNREALENYLQEQRKLINPIVLLDKIKIDSLFQVGGFFMWLSGRTGNQLLFKCANQLILSTEDEATLKKVVKFVNRRKENKEIKIYESDKLNEEMLGQLYNTFLYKLQNSVYGNRLGEQAKTLSSKKEKFDELQIEEKCVVLYEILHMFQCQSVASDLKLIEGPGKAGILVLNSNITKCKNICVINQSPTGIYEKVIDLQKL